MSQHSLMPVWPARHTRSAFLRLAVLAIPVPVLTPQDTPITAGGVGRRFLEPKA